MGKLVAFSLFQDLDLVVSQIGNEMEDGESKFLSGEEGTVQQDSILREDNLALHPFMSQNTRALFCFSSTIYKILMLFI